MELGVRCPTVCPAASRCRPCQQDVVQGPGYSNSCVHVLSNLGEHDNKYGSTRMMRETRKTRASRASRTPHSSTYSRESPHRPRACRASGPLSSRQTPDRRTYNSQHAYRSHVWPTRSTSHAPHAERVVDAAQQPTAARPRHSRSPPPSAWVGCHAASAKAHTCVAYGRRAPQRRRGASARPCAVCTHARRGRGCPA